MVPGEQTEGSRKLLRSRQGIARASDVSLRLHGELLSSSMTPYPMSHSSTSICDGCGTNASDTHVRERILRLEWATRFRPLHIQTLLLTTAPPAAAADFFYAPSGEGGSAEEQGFILAVLGACGIQIEGKERAHSLGELQRHGTFVASVHECPGFVHPDALERLALRIRLSYRPKFIVPLDSQAQTAIRSSEDRIGAAKIIALPPAASVAPAGWTTLASQLRECLHQCRG